MYLGLYLMIPFLNRLYDTLTSKKEKYVLVGSLAFLTFLPQIVKTFKVNGAFLDTTIDYWQIIYPITYFYIGKMIKEFQPHFAYWKRILFFVIALAIPCTCCFFFSTETEYAWYTFNGFEALTTVLVATAIFLLFYDFDKNIPVIGKMIREVSICSFEMYLFSSIWDKYLYTVLDYKILIMVPIIIVSTYFSAKLFILLRDFILCFNKK